MKKFLFLPALIAAAVLTLSCERPENTDPVPDTVLDTTPSQPAMTYDTLPNSEWWECNQYSGIYILLNISWEDGLLNSYTNLHQTPQCFINDSIFSFELVGDTIFYDGIPHPYGWLVDFTSDTTMTWTLNSPFIPSKILWSFLFEKKLEAMQQFLSQTTQKDVSIFSNVIVYKSNKLI